MQTYHAEKRVRDADHEKRHPTTVARMQNIALDSPQPFQNDPAVVDKFDQELPPTKMYPHEGGAGLEHYHEIVGVRTLAQLGKSMSLAGPSHAERIREKVNLDAIGALNGFVVIKRELTSADHTFVLPPFDSFNEAVRSYLYWRILDVTILRALQTSQAINSDCRSEVVDADYETEIIEVRGRDKVFCALLPASVMGDGNCCLHACSVALWGIQDRLSTLRNALSMMLKEQNKIFYARWKAQEQAWDAMDAETLGLEKPIERSESQWLQEWKEILDSADRDHAHLTHIHLYALAHILQRPIIVFASKETEHTICRLRGIYLPAEFRDIDSGWRGEKIPVILAYESSHFVPLVCHLKAWPPCRNDKWPMFPIEIDGELLPILFVDKNKLYERHSNIVEALKSFISCEKLPEGPLCVKYMIRKERSSDSRCQFESELSTHTLGMIEDFLTECNSVVTQYVHVQKEPSRVEKAAETPPMTPSLLRQDSMLARQLQQMYDEELLNDHTRIPDEWRSTIDI
uniref:OTU domain-containing protein n=1 Tax=Hanusia phi TaxID=3032 RepID=A0A7S0E1C0_9CRYP|mmetsp:Transcript_14823/g.34063  ORF Transcript_14823/g.34063 Transcript_14823/m.34063 type:complete len:516 (+) Transcript_14823:43-1590(+)